MSRPDFLSELGIRSATLVEPDGKRIPLRLPELMAKVLLADEPVSAAPDSRGCEHAVPVHVATEFEPIEQTEDTETVRAHCWECGAPLGVVEMEVATLFGRAEDKAMTGKDGGKRWRVYDGTGPDAVRERVGVDR